MNKSDFYYDLPEELIAQEPVTPRDASRLMVLDRDTGEIAHRHFYDIADELQAGDCLVINDTKVLPARLYGIKQPTGARVEFLLLNQKSGDVWECITGPGRKAQTGTVFSFGDGLMQGTVKEVLENGNRLVEFSYDGVFFEVLDRIGEMPLPHYITKKLADKDRYQTVYARERGSAAAPTAGLHFTPQLLEELKSKGVAIARITLHVGLGTFRPVKTIKCTPSIIPFPPKRLNLSTPPKKQGDGLLLWAQPAAARWNPLPMKMVFCPRRAAIRIFLFTPAITSGASTR